MKRTFLRGLTALKQNLGYVYTDGAVFKDTLAKDNAYFKGLITKLNLKP